MSKKLMWNVRSSRSILKKPIFEIFEKDCYLPSKQIEHPFYSIHLYNWVNIFAVTEDKQVIMVQQHRLGIDQLTIEVPAGAVDHGEEPEAAAIRELAEETGYSPGNIIKLKEISVNPAIQNNCCSAFIALDCRKTGETSFDTSEQLEIVFKTLQEAFEMLDTDQMDNSLSYLTLLLARDYCKAHGII